MYTIRLTTGLSRGAALSDPYAAVNVCLVGAGGTSALYRISPVNDPMESRQLTMEICEVGGRTADVLLGGIQPVKHAEQGGYCSGIARSVWVQLMPCCAAYTLAL